MKKYIRTTTDQKKLPILSSISIDALDALGEDDMLRICNSYKDSEGNYGSFDSSDEMDKFGIIWLRLRRLGYNV